MGLFVGIYYGFIDWNSNTNALFDEAQMTNCICEECPKQHQRVICGWLLAGTPCAHPDWRAVWAALLAQLREREAADGG